jgi:proteasome lid subunit RPN8/RPN11
MVHRIIRFRWDEPLRGGDQARRRPAYLPPMLMTQSVYRRVMQRLGDLQPEAAGVLLGPQDDEPLATHFALDELGTSTAASFTLGTEFLNGVLQQHRVCDLTCVGIVHSHPAGCTTPSCGDLAYLRRLFDAAELNQFLFPIYCAGRLYPFLVWRDEDELSLTPASLLLV